jgi:hypothetical protein
MIPNIKIQAGGNLTDAMDRKDDIKYVFPVPKTLSTTPNKLHVSIGCAALLSLYDRKLPHVSLWKEKSSAVFILNNTCFRATSAFSYTD